MHHDLRGLLRRRILPPVEINLPQSATLAPPCCLVNFWLMRGGILGLCWFLVGFKMTPFSFQIDRSTTRTFIRYFLSQTMTARPQAKLLLDSTADWKKKNEKKTRNFFSLSLSLTRFLKITVSVCVYTVHKQACVWARLSVCAFKCGCVPTVCVYITLPEKMEKALSFSQKIIGPQSNYEWLTHEVKSQDWPAQANFLNYWWPAETNNK